MSDLAAQGATSLKTPQPTCSSFIMSSQGVVMFLGVWPGATVVFCFVSGKSLQLHGGVALTALTGAGFCLAIIQLYGNK